MNDKLLIALRERAATGTTLRMEVDPKVIAQLIDEYREMHDLLTVILNAVRQGLGKVK